MSSADALRTDFSRYARLIEDRLRDATFTPPAESATTVRIERGIVLAQALLATPPSSDMDPVDRLIELANSQRIGQIAVLDAAGHRRAVYRPLLVYAWLRAFALRYETLTPAQFGRWDESLRAWADEMESDLGRTDLAQLPAARGDLIAAAAWSALALHVAGKVFIRDAWTDLASDTFGRLTRAQQPSGAFLAATASDNPEPLWYHELAILHAAASYAVQAEDRPLARAVARASVLHLNETQPDHATSQPWGLFAFIWNEPARPLADQLLHAVSLQPTDGVSLILLADALYSLRLFL
jgi:hypothetical protein